MVITLLNIYNDTIYIQDLGIELESNESLELLTNFIKDEIIQSQDLETIYNNNYIQFLIDNNVSTYSQVIDAITGMTSIQHENLDTLQHNLSEPAYFETTKNSEQKTYLITYYADSTKTLKIRQEEIIRDNDGKTSQIILRQYDNDGNVYKTEIQTLNRSAQGTIQSIEVTNV